MITVEGSWKFSFKRCLTDIEVQEFASLLFLIGDSPSQLDTLPDTRKWTFNTTGIFTVKFLYTKLVETNGLE